MTHGKPIEKAVKPIGSGLIIKSNNNAIANINSITINAGVSQIRRSAEKNCTVDKIPYGKGNVPLIPVLFSSDRINIFIFKIRCCHRRN